MSIMNRKSGKARRILLQRLGFLVSVSSSLWKRKAPGADFPEAGRKCIYMLCSDEERFKSFTRKRPSVKAC